MIGIICAMDEEILRIKANMKKVNEKQIGPRTFYIGIFEKQEIVLVKSFEGKVNSTLTATLLLENFEINYVINTGIAGGVHPCEPGDVVISTGVVYHDVDVTSYRCDYKYGQIPGMPHIYFSEPTLIEKTKDIAEKLGINYKLGIIATGDSFIKEEEVLKRVKKEVENIIAVDMEGTAISQVCHLYNKPSIIIRSISDIVSKSKNINFDELIDKACENVYCLLKELFK